MDEELIRIRLRSGLTSLADSYAMEMARDNANFSSMRICPPVYIDKPQKRTSQLVSAKFMPAGNSPYPEWHPKFEHHDNVCEKISVRSDEEQFQHMANCSEQEIVQVLTHFILAERELRFFDDYLQGNRFEPLPAGHEIEVTWDEPGSTLVEDVREWCRIFNSPMRAPVVGPLTDVIIPINIYLQMTTHKDMEKWYLGQCATYHEKLENLFQHFGAKSKPRVHCVQHDSKYILLCHNGDVRNWRKGAMARLVYGRLFEEPNNSGLLILHSDGVFECMSYECYARPYRTQGMICGPCIK